MISFIFWTIFVICLFHFFVYHQYNWPRVCKLVNKIPGPRELFYFGSTATFYFLKNEDILPTLTRNFEKYGTTVRYWFGGIPGIFISELDDVQIVLGSRWDSAKGEMYRHIRGWLGTGLLLSSRQKWHKMRKIITPTFHFTVLHSYVDIFNKNIKKLLTILDNEENKDEVDFGKLCTYCALDNVCETAMGIKLNSLTTGQENSYVKAIFHLGKIIIYRLFSPFIFTDRIFYLTPLGWKHWKILNTLHGFTLKIIEEKRQEMLKNTKKADNDENKRKCFLEMLLENQVTHNLSDEDIRQEVDTFMFEGHDTTATAIIWTLFELGHHQEIQEKVYEEMTNIFGDSDRSATYQDLMEMTYTKRVLMETLRLYPSVPVISRKFDVDIQIRDYLVPARTELILVLYHIHRNPKSFPEPEKFDPDRFLPEEIEKRHPFAYVPFSAGPRNCIGQKFAMLEELVIISSIIRNYKIISLNDRNTIKVSPELILRPCEKLLWKVIKR